MLNYPLGLWLEQQQECVVALLCLLSNENDDSKWVITAAGGIHPLCICIETRSVKAKEDATMILSNLSEWWRTTGNGGEWWLTVVKAGGYGGELERISKKRTKNEAKTTKPDTEWKSVEKTKSRQSPSVKKSTKVNPDKSKVKK
ncbi:cellulose synthase interactive 1-like protein [Tanacetum coccineum]